MIATANRLDLRRVSVAELRREHLASWQAMGREHFMSHPAWLLPAWELFHSREPGVDSAGDELTGLFDEAGQLRALAPWFLQRRWGLRVRRLIGSGAVCSDYVRLIRPEPDSGPATDDAGNGHGEPEPCWSAGRSADVIEVEGHLLGCPAWESLFAGWEAAGWRRMTVPIEGSWRAELPVTWEAFEQRVHRSRRRKARKAMKLLDQGVVRHRIAADPAALQQEWSSFQRLHQLRRAQLGQPGCFADPDFARFLHQAALELAAEGRCWLSIVENSDGPLAMLLMFDGERTSYMYQSGLETGRMDLEPGHLVNTFTIREAIQRGKREFDWLRGDEPYKSGWGAQRLPLARTRMFAPGWKGTGLWALLRARGRLLQRNNPGTSADPSSREESEHED